MTADRTEWSCPNTGRTCTAEDCGNECFQGAAEVDARGSVTMPYALSMLRVKVALGNYDAELLLRHAMTLLDRPRSTDPDERTGFEEWATGQMILLREGDGYKNPWAQLAWDGWQARAFFKPQPKAAQGASADEWVRAIAPLMPADFKDWHENSPREWPAVTAAVITALRESEAFWIEQAGKPKAQPKGMAEGTVLVARGLLKEARDNAEASCAESGVSHGRLEYRKELVQRLEAAMVANFAERPAKPIGVEVVGVVRPGGEDGPSVEWLLEGGLHAVAEGGETYLLVSHSPITNDDGHGEVVRVNHED